MRAAHGLCNLVCFGQRLCYDAPRAWAWAWLAADPAAPPPRRCPARRLNCQPSRSRRLRCCARHSHRALDKAWSTFTGEVRNIAKKRMEVSQVLKSEVTKDLATFSKTVMPDQVPSCCCV